MDLRKKLNNLNQRRFDTATKTTILSEAARSSRFTETERYLLGAMEEVSVQQTEIVIRTGERVKNHLETSLNASSRYPDFDYQGSVTNNTHIKVHSDIDLLAVTGDYFTRKNGSYAHLPSFTGSPEVVMTDLRTIARNSLTLGFPAATVKEKSRCLRITGGSLQREVDVVLCNWIKNRDYEKDGKKFHLGIRILDTETGEWIENYPFMHNEVLAHQDAQVRGNLKRVVRLLKCLKEDADQKISVSSYDICGLVYNWTLGNAEAEYGARDFRFLESLFVYLRSLEATPFLRSDLKVPNGTRLLFSPDGLSVAEMKKLTDELHGVLSGLRAATAPGLTRRNAFSEYLNNRGLG